MAIEAPHAAPEPSDLLHQMLVGFQYTQALHAAVRLGVFEALRQEAKTAEELGEVVGANPSSLRRLLRFLVAADALALDQRDRFTPTAAGELLCSNHPESQRPWAMLLGDPCIWQPWGNLWNAVRAGKPAFELTFGESFFEYLGSHPETASLFNEAMGGDGGEVSAVVAAYDFSPFGRFVDVGGGHGALLEALLRRCPGATGVLYDLPFVVEEAQGLRSSDVAERCELMGGDMFVSVPAGGDAYLLKRVVHDWSDAEALRILCNCREAMDERGKLLLIESVLVPSEQGDPATLKDLMMLVLVSGRERSEDEFRALLKAAGFRLAQIVPAGSRSILEAVPE